MGKKQIIIIAIVGLVSFVGMFVPTWIVRKKTQKAPELAAQTQTTDEATAETESSTDSQTASSSSSSLFTVAKPQRSITEEQFKNYVFDLREQMEQYKEKMNLLKTKEQQIELIQQTLNDDIKELEDLRVKLASTVVKLKAEREKLKNSQLEISGIEKSNLRAIAATYNVMDASSASRIMTNMCMTQTGAKNTDGLDGAVKILKYMEDRALAKVLAEMSNSELAAVITNRLKQTIEKG